MMVLRFAVLVLLIGPCLGAAPQDSTPFRSRSDLVVLHVTVQNRRGAYVNNLPASAFDVSEDGKPQTIAVFGREDDPVTAGLVIDSSVSMRDVRDLVIAGGAAFAEASNDKDQFFAIAFNDVVTPALPGDAPFTSEASVLRRALVSAVTARGRTALFDAISAAVDYAERGEHPRRALIVISDGGDNASRTSFDQVVVKLQTSNVIVYTVALVDPLDHEANPKRMKQLAQASGGDAFEPKSAAQVADVLREIARELRHSYTLAYAPASADDGRFHRLRVTVTAPGGERLVVRTRSGYLAAKSATAGTR